MDIAAPTDSQSGTPVAGDPRWAQILSRDKTADGATPGVAIDLPLDVRGTAFQQRLWTALREIPLGSTASYAGIAKAIGAPKAVRAVAGACSANALAVVIPCHRVVRNDGELSGYRWGIERKRVLLAREAEAA